MLSLVKLYSAANPDAGEAVSTKAIKRRFMNGISNEVRQSLYIFCNNPHAIIVTYQQLLELARKAKMHIFESKCDKQSLDVLTVLTFDENISNQTTPGYSSILSNQTTPGYSSILSNQTTPGYSSILAAISNLDQNLNARIDLIANNYSNQVHGINAITRGRGYYRGNNRYNRNNRENYNVNRNASLNWRNNIDRNNEQSQDILKCFKCSGDNHFARHCRSKKHVKAPVEKLVGADINNFNLKKDRRNNKLLWFKGKLNGQLFELLLDCGASTCCIAKRCVTSNHVLKKIPKLP